jgi:hypothetical protein
MKVAQPQAPSPYQQTSIIIYETYSQQNNTGQSAVTVGSYKAIIFIIRKFLVLYVML